jgi:mannan polymerase II complex MNN10 subunit
VSASTLTPPVSSRNRGFFSRHIRKISSSLPQFRPEHHTYAQKEKLGRGQWSPRGFKPMLVVRNILSRMSRKLKIRLLMALVLFLLVLAWYLSRRFHQP